MNSSKSRDVAPLRQNGKVNGRREAPIVRTSYMRARRATPVRAAATKKPVVDASDDENASGSDYDSASDAEDEVILEEVKPNNSAASKKSATAASKQKSAKHVDVREDTEVKAGSRAALSRLTAAKGIAKAAPVRAAPKKRTVKGSGNSDDSSSDVEKNFKSVAKKGLSKSAPTSSKKLTKKDQTHNDDSDVSDVELQRSSARNSTGRATPKAIKKKRKEESSDSGYSDSDVEEEVEELKSSSKKRLSKLSPKSSSKKSKRDLSDEDDADSGSDIDAQDSKATTKKKVFKKGTSESVIRKHEYHVHRDDWLSRPITKYAAEYSLPSPMGRKDLTSAIFTDLWGGKSLPISKWIAAQSELNFGQSGTVLSAPEAALDIKSDDNGSTQSIFIRPYEGAVVVTDSAAKNGSIESSEIDLYLNTAGPIWCIAYAPIRKDVSQQPSILLEKYLAVGTSRIGWLDSNTPRTLAGTCEVGDDIPYTLGAKYTTPNLLQIWKVQSTKVDSTAGKKKTNPPRTSTETKASLEYCVGLPSRGPVWKAVWSTWTPFSPSDGDLGDDVEDTESARETCEKCLNFLGIIAVVCGDGSCLVLVLPRKATPDFASPTPSVPSSSSSSSSSSSTSAKIIHSKSSSASASASTSTSSPPVERVPVISEISVCRWVVTVPRASVGSKYSGASGDECCSILDSLVRKFFIIRAYLCYSCDIMGIASVSSNKCLLRHSLMSSTTLTTLPYT